MTNDITEELEAKTNPAVVDAVHMLLHPMSNPIKHGDFNRHMFIEALAIKAGQGCGMSEEDICDHACMTSKEFSIIKDEYITNGTIIEKGNMFGVVLYYMNMY